jgi:hypothetical protein
VTKERIFRAGELEFRWNGAHTVNVYIPHSGRTRDEDALIDTFTLGDFSKRAATKTEVEQRVGEYVQAYQERG